MIKVQRFNVQSHKIKCLVYGEPGSGKTVFGSTAPKPFWLSAEGGLASVMHTAPVGIEIKSLQDLKDAYSYIKTEAFIKDGLQFDSICIDSITEINDIIKDEIRARKGGRELEGKDWAKVQDEIKSILRKFRDLDKHVIFIALAKESRDEEKIDKIVPMLNGQAARDIAAYMDLVCYVGVDKTGKHYVITKGDQKYLTKDRFNQFPADIEPNFAVMQGYIEALKVQKNEVLSSYESDATESDDSTLPEPSARKYITADQSKMIVVTWNRLWELLMSQCGKEVDSRGELKYTPEKSDATRKATMKAIVGVDSTSAMTEEMAKEFFAKLNEKISMLEANNSQVSVEEYIAEKKTELSSKEETVVTKKSKKKS